MKLHPLGFLCAALSLLTLSVCHPAHAQGPKTFDVTQAPYNANNTGSADASPAINRAVTDAVTYGNANHVAVTVFLPAGTYFLQNDLIRIQGVQNTLTFTGHSADDTFLTYTNYQNNGVFDLAYNNNAAKTATVTIQNITEDVNSAAEFGFTQGTIIGIDRKAKPYPTITVRAEAGYPLLNRPDVVAVTIPSTYYNNGYPDGNIDTLYTFSDPKTSLHDGDQAGMKTITPSSDGTTAVIAVDHIPSHNYIGTPWMILSNSEITHNNNNGNNNNHIRSGTAIYGGDNVTLQNINYYGGNVAVNDGGANLDGNITFLNYYQGAPPAVSQPGRPARPGIPADRRQACYEGFQMQIRGTTSVINCDFSGGSDDPFDIGSGSNSARLLSQIDSTHIRINRNDKYLPGDIIEIATPDYGTVYAKNIQMTGIAAQGDGTFIATLNQAVTIQHFDTGDGKSGDLLTDLSTAGPIVLQNSSFSALLGHLFIRSGSSIMVDHCLIHDISYSGIEVSGSVIFNQGPFTAHNVTIQNSTFRNCQQGCITSLSGTAANGENIKILNNTFQDTTNAPFGDLTNDSGIGTALEVDGVNGLTISGNTFDRNWGANIGARYNANVVITGNTFNHPNFIRPIFAAPYSGKNADPSAVVWLSDTNGITLSGNLVNDAGPFTKALVEVKTNVTNATGLTTGITQTDSPLVFYLAYDNFVMDQPASGSILDQAAWTGGKNQQWLTLPAASTPGFATLTDYSNGKYVGNGTSTAPGASIVLENQSGSGGLPVAEQLWDFASIDGTTANILNDFSSGFSTGSYSPGNPSVINVLSGSSAAGTKLGQWYPGSAPNQNFAVLAPPTPLVQANYGNVTLNWAPVSNATGYTVSRATSSGGTYGTLGTTAGMTYTDGSGTPGTTYYYKVAASGLPLALTSTPQAAKPATTATNVPVNLSPYFNVTGIEPNGWFFLGDGFDGYNYAYSSALVPATLSWSGDLFTLGQPARPDCISDVGQRIVLPTGNFSSLLFLGSYLGGTGTFTPTLTYTDGSSTVLSQGMTNWCGAASQPGESNAGTYAYRNNGVGGSAGKQTYTNYIHGYSLALDATKTVQWLDLPNTGSFRVMAMNLNATASTFATGAVLIPGQYITSPTKKYFLIQQPDGDLALYSGSGPASQGTRVWDSGHHDPNGAGNFFTLIQGDGNLLTLMGTPGTSSSYAVAWASGTYGGANYYLQVTDAGQVQIMCGNAPVWINGVNQQSTVLAQGGFLTTGETLASPSGNCYVVQQDDGNLVLYNGTPANRGPYIWASSSETGIYYPAGGSYYLAMQGDGSLKTYSGTPSAPTGSIWNSATSGHPNSYLRVTDSKQLQIVNGTTVLWQRP